MKNVDLSSTLELESPLIAIPWGISESEFRVLISGNELEEDSTEGFTTFSISDVKVFGITDLRMVFRFDLSPGKLTKVEFLHGGRDFMEKHHETVEVLRAIFGDGESLEKEDGGFSGIKWEKDGVELEAFIWPSASGEVAMLVLTKK
jgi:hypothetical protein